MILLLNVKKEESVSDVMLQKVTKLWKQIADFEEHEIRNDSTNPLLANARQSARMEAYTKLMEREIGNKL